MNNPKTPYKFTPYAPKPHPREQDINQAQPPVKTMKAIGNGQERKHGFGSGH